MSLFILHRLVREGGLCLRDMRALHRAPHSHPTVTPQSPHRHPTVSPQPALSFSGEEWAPPGGWRASDWRLGHKVGRVPHFWRQKFRTRPTRLVPVDRCHGIGRGGWGIRAITCVGAERLVIGILVVEPPGGRAEQGNIQPGTGGRINETPGERLTRGRDAMLSLRAAVPSCCRSWIRPFQSLWRGAGTSCASRGRRGPYTPV